MPYGSRYTTRAYPKVYPLGQRHARIASLRRGCEASPSDSASPLGREI